MRFPLVFTALMALAAPTSLSAQAGSGPFIAIPDAFPAIEGRAIVIREPGVELVLLREDEVTVEALSVALRVLREARAREPSPRHGQMIPITGFVLGAPVERDERRRLEKTLERLGTAGRVDLGSIGTGRRVGLTGR